MSEFPIQAGIPIPVTPRAEYGSVVDTLRKMEVGDSVGLDGPSGESLRTASYRIKGAKFRVGRMEDGSPRIWRIS